MINRLSKNGSKSTSQLSHSIESATDGNVKKTEDWSLFMGICDLINTSEDGPKEAIKTFKKKFATKHQQTIVLTLSLLETCVKNCGKRFHVQLATKDFLQDFMKIINPKNNYSVALQNTVLGLLQTWAFAFQNSPELKEVNKTYQDLKAKRVEFPPLDADKASPAYISPQSASVSSCVVESSGHNRPQQTAAGTAPAYHDHRHHLQQQQHPTQTSSSSSSSHQNQQKIQKLKSELSAVQQNCRVFGELLTELSQGGTLNSASDQQLLEELNRTCRDMQRRILDLLQNSQIDDEITDDLLHINDELNNEFVRYDRYHHRMVKSNSQNTLLPTATGEIESTEKVAGAAAATTTTTNSYVAVANLIDLNDSPSIASAGGGAAVINSRLNNLTLQSALYTATGQDPFSPLQHQKDIVLDASSSSSYNPELLKQEEVNEMETWLKMNEGSENVGTSGGEDRQSACNNSSTATSSEFERFLDRASHVPSQPKN
ncbi:hypothetical protein HELRODRAFT_110832 [Helobdella robusta]|uniref:VHS domain-containing protein n=1 Tax=Helobdella robusta TaxID=6412 RepID=T1EF55_HELRO|nr:hypothetical protein HELRODRAFT_110832 [Helobdella robusta]ESO07415.1 hypothetical protein HELRODRAFT_110832 [Helobdella robusta]